VGKRRKFGELAAALVSAAALAIGLGLTALALFHPAEALRPVAAIAPPLPLPSAPAAPAIEAPPPERAPVRPDRPDDIPAWRRNAVPVGAEDGRPMIAIVLDDMGVDRKRSAVALALPGPLTLSFMAYAEDLAGQTGAGRAHGHELMLHIPMQPLAASADPGRNALTVDLDDAEIRRRLSWDLDRIGGIVGANNHMGSRFTEWPHGMEVVETVLRERGLFVLDSRTTPRTVVIEVADRLGVPHAKRDVFLDDDMAATAVARELDKTETVARRNGFAVAIGHPHDATVAALRDWLPTLAAKGFRLVPVSAIVIHNETAAGRIEDTAD
jgi:polysaccharide deacetylase 2 family uncharacterized protein YibQ